MYCMFYQQWKPMELSNWPGSLLSSDNLWQLINLIEATCMPAVKKRGVSFTLSFLVLALLSCFNVRLPNIAFPCPCLFLLLWLSSPSLLLLFLPLRTSCQSRQPCSAASVRTQSPSVLLGWMSRCWPPWSGVVCPITSSTRRWAKWVTGWAGWWSALNLSSWWLFTSQRRTGQRQS